MAWILLICSHIVALLDMRAVRLISSNIPTRKRILIALLFLDFLPFTWMGISLLFWRDNPTWMTPISMWLQFLYMNLVIARGPALLLYVVSRNRVIHTVGIILSISIISLFIYSATSTRTDYQIKHITLHSERLPVAFDGYRIVQISDLHIGAMVNAESELQQIVTLCNSEQADLLAFTGDLIDIRSEEITKPITTILSQLKARDGVYAVTGNHDMGVYVRDSLNITYDITTARVIAAEQAMGWHTLDNTTRYIRRDKDSISVTGISFDVALQEKRHSSKLPDINIKRAYKDVPSDIFNITLTHIPQHWDEIVQDKHGDITLAGHIHAMQIKLPIGERGISPSQIKYKRWSGLYEQQGRWLYINDGIGYGMYPMRIGARPEITVIELKHRSK